MPRPPSTGTTDPVTYAAASDARKPTTAATSSGDRTRHAYQARLGSGVIGLTGEPHEGPHRRDEHDPAAVEPQHLGDGALRDPVRAGEVRLDHVLPRVLAHPQHERVAGDAGVRHQHLDRPPLLLDGTEGRVHLLGIRHVAGDGEDLPGRSLGRGVPSVRERHPVAVRGEPLGARGADPSRAARDEDDPPGVAHRPPSPPTRSHTSGWPSWTRSPATDSQRTTSPANGVRTSVTPTR